MQATTLIDKYKTIFSQQGTHQHVHTNCGTQFHSLETLEFQKDTMRIHYNYKQLTSLLVKKSGNIPN